MKKVTKMIFSALLCCVMFFMVACGGGSSVGKEAAKDLCECSTKISNKSGLEMLACMMILASKYQDHFDDNQNFKNTADQKAFIAALKKCDPELAKSIEENKKK